MKGESNHPELGISNWMVERWSRMSQENVDKLITRLMSEEDLRSRFALDRFDVIADLLESGLPLTPHEIDLFVQSDGEIWRGEYSCASGSLN
jgi:hypothetical protein